MRKLKFLLSSMMIFVMALFNFIPFVNVHAEGGIGQTGTSIVKTDELQKESTVYAGEIFVDGSSQMQWLYSSDISNQQTVFENLKTSLNGTTFADLVPTLDENTDNNGLAVSSSHQSDMNNSWTSANYVANQFYTGTIGTETNGNLYDNNTTYKNNIDTSYSSHQGEVDNPIDFSKRVLSTLSVASDYEIVSIEGVPTKVITITFNLEATTVIYTRVDVTTTTATATPITSANVTLTAPKVGEKVEKITKNDGYGDYETQSANPIVSTTTEGIDIYAFWVNGLEDLAEESFYGTFEKDKYYYAMIDFEAQEGYELPSTFPDGIKVNGVAPDEIFAVYGGTYTHCIVKIKATTEETKQKEYTINSSTNSGDSISFTALEGTVYSFYIKDRKDTTDEELKQIVDLMDEPEYTFESLKAQLNKLIGYGKSVAGDDGTLLKLYEIYLYDNGVEIHNVDGGFKLKIKITDDMKGYDSYKLIYIAEDGTSEKAIELTKNGEYLEGKLSHLSMYALVGSKTTTNDTKATSTDTKTNNTKNPSTGDGVTTTIMLLAFSMIGLIITGGYRLKKKFVKID